MLRCLSLRGLLNGWPSEVHVRNRWQQVGGRKDGHLGLSTGGMGISLAALGRRGPAVLIPCVSTPALAATVLLWLRMQAAVIGVTTRQDVLEMLEKRVKSRFSHRKLDVVLPTSLRPRPAEAQGGGAGAGGSGGSAEDDGMLDVLKVCWGPGLWEGCGVPGCWCWR